MFNPYVGGVSQSLRPVEGRGPEKGGLGGILSRLGNLDSGDLLLLLLIYLLVREQEDGHEKIWPLVAAALYLMLE